MRRRMFRLLLQLLFFVLTAGRHLRYIRQFDRWLLTFLIFLVGLMPETIAKSNVAASDTEIGDEGDASLKIQPERNVLRAENPLEQGLAKRPINTGAPALQDGLNDRESDFVPRRRTTAAVEPVAAAVNAEQQTIADTNLEKLRQDDTSSTMSIEKSATPDVPVKVEERVEYRNPNLADMDVDATKNASQQSADNADPPPVVKSDAPAPGSEPTKMPPQPVAAESQQPAQNDSSPAQDDTPLAQEAAPLKTISTQTSGPTSAPTSTSSSTSSSPSTSENSSIDVAYPSVDGNNDDAESGEKESGLGVEQDVTEEPEKQENIDPSENAAETAQKPLKEVENTQKPINVAEAVPKPMNVDENVNRPVAAVDQYSIVSNQAENNHFMLYMIMMSTMVAVLYFGYHNRQKVLGELGAGFPYYH